MLPRAQFGGWEAVVGGSEVFCELSGNARPKSWWSTRSWSSHFVFRFFFFF